MAKELKARRIQRAREEAHFWYDIEVRSLGYWDRGVSRPRRFNVQAGFAPAKPKDAWNG